MGAREGPAAEPDGADGPHSVIIGNADVGAVGFFVDGHFRNNGDTHSRSHHVDQAAELATFENNPRMKPSAVTSGDGVFAETMAVAQEKERFGSKLLKRDGMQAREAVIFGESGEKRLGENGESFKFVPADG